MKKLTPILLFVAIVIALTACSVVQTVPTASPSSQTPAPASSQTPAPTVPAQTAAPSASPSATPAEQEPQDGYFGEFNVIEEAASGVNTYSQADINKMIGKTLSFYKDEAVIINDRPSDSPVEIKNPQYSESVLTVEDFIAAYRVPAEKLGLSSGDITEILISDPSSAVGGCALILQGDQIYICAGGVFFALERISLRLQ